MKKVITILILLLCTATTQAQKQGQELIDSLMKELPKTEQDTNKVVLLRDISYWHGEIMDYKKGFEYAEKALALAEKLNWRKGITLAYRNLGRVYHDTGDPQKAIEVTQKGLLPDVKKSYPDEYINSLYKIFVYYGTLNDSAKYIQISKEIDALSLIAKRDQDRSELYLELGQFLIEKNSLDLGMSYLLKAHCLKSSIGDTANYIRNMENMATVYSWDNKLEKAMQFHIQLLDFYKKGKDSLNIAHTLSKIGVIYSKQEQQFTAIEHYWAAHEIFQQQKDSYGIAHCYNLIGSSYFVMFLYEKALSYYLQALKIIEDSDDATLLGAILNDLTTLYETIGNYDKALEYLLRAKKKFEEIEDKSFLGYTNVDIGRLYMKLDKPDSAILHIQMAAEIFKDLKNQNLSKFIVSSLTEEEGLASCNTVIGQVYFRQKRYAEALSVQKSALEFYRSTEDKNRMSSIMGQMAQTYTGAALHRNINAPDSLSRQSSAVLLRKSIALSLESNILAEELKKLDLLRDNYENLTSAYEHTGDYKSALESHRLQTLYNDSIWNSEKIKTITSIDLQYDFDKKEAQTQAEHEKQVALAQAKHKARLQTGAVLAAALIIILSGGFFFYRRRENDKIKLEMAALKQEALNAQMSDHFITNTMDSINHFIKNNDKDKASAYLVRFSRIIRNVLENAAEKTISLNDDLNVLKDYLELEKLRFKDHNLHYEITLDPAIDADKMRIPPMVFQTLAENAIQHAFTKTGGSKLTFTISKENNKVFCTVEDNGVGRKQSLQYKNDTGKKHISLGGSLAEKLVKTVSKYSKETSFRITDLLDNNNNPAGTKVDFSLPYIVTG